VERGTFQIAKNLERCRKSRDGQGLEGVGGAVAGFGAGGFGGGMSSSMPSPSVFGGGGGTMSDSMLHSPSSHAHTPSSHKHTPFRAHASPGVAFPASFQILDF
jgi:hypothetical protein